MSGNEAIEMLHVDDDEEFLDLAATFLERENDAIDVETEADPERALERIGRDVPAFDCVVVDFDMPGMTGLAFLESLRERHPDLPVILFTGKGSEEIASEAIAAGVTDYLQKSAVGEQFAVLANRIDNAVSGYRARREVERTQRRFRKLIEGTVDVISVFDEDGNWTYVSPAVESVFGFDPEELIGESGFGNVHPEDEERVARHFEELRERPGSQTRVRARAQAADGSWVHLDVTGHNLLDDPDVEGILLHGHDVTERKERERALAELHETSRALMAAESREAVLQRGVDAADSILDLEMASFYVLDDGLLEPYATAEGTAETLGGIPTMEPGSSLAWQVFESGEPITSDDVRERDGVMNPDTPVRSEMILPMREGVFIAASTEVGAFDDTDVSLAKVLVANVEAALDRAERERRLRENEATLEALHEATQVVMGAETEAEVLDALVDTAEEVLGFRRVSVWRFDDDADAFEPVVPGDDDAVEVSPLRGEGFGPWQAFHDGEARVLAGDELGEAALGDDEPMRSGIVVPFGDHGVLCSGSTEPDRFDETDRYLAEILARTTAASLDRLKRETVLERLHGATRALMGLDSAEAVAERSVETANEILGYHNVLVRFLSDDGYLHPVASTDPDHLGEDGRPVYRVGEGAAGRTFERGEPFHVNVRDIDDGIDRDEAESMLYVPMGDHGILSIADTDPDAFDESAIQLANILASNAETALDRIERQRALERQNERLDEFASVVSHDLRNPLNVAMTYVRQLQRERGDDRLDRVDDSLERIDAIVGDVLTLARSGRDVADPQPVVIGGVATEAWGTAGGPDAHLELDGVGESILGDRSRLLSLLENLFRNAREHGGEDVTVRIGTTTNGFYVEDDGPGIDPDDRDRAVESGYTTSGEGTGFGLAIVAQIAEAHGWTVTIAEGKNGGARFEFGSVEKA